MPFRALRPFALATCLALPPAVLTAEVSGDDVAAIAFAAKQDFLNAYAKAGSDDRLMRDLVTWQRLRFGDAVFGDYVTFAAQYPDWPGQDVLRTAGEGLIPADYDPQTIVDWFADTAPMTARGTVRLAGALETLGQDTAARDVVRTAWTSLSLDTTGQVLLLDAYGDMLADLHAARADALLWRWQASEAEQMLPLLDADQQALVRARIALIRKTGDPDDVLDAVPAALRDAPGLRYDQFNWLADRGRQTDAIAILAAQSTSATALGEPWRWASWRRILARWQMRQGNYQDAYDLAANHHVTAADSAASYADLEWLAGYLQLRFLDDPVLALIHFDNAGAEVNSPISLGRAGYWRGRALEAQDRTEEARAAYAQGAQHQTSFYGLLAAEKLGIPLDPFLTGQGDPRDWRDAAVMDHDLVRAGLVLLRAGERGKAILFFAEAGKVLSAEDLSRLGAAMEAEGETYFEVLLGKTAAARGLIVPSVYYPLHGLADMDLPVPSALALSIARRESEFNIAAGSPVGALGLMQLMPGTAQDVARSLDLPYNKARLTTDWTYNATLGSRYLADLIERFGNSPVQVAAGYNAGPGRPRDWMQDRGDPRGGEVDVIDWIEMIPFRETRNYVQRVTESLPIYEARLTGTVGQIRFTDLLLGEGNVVRPTARPDGTLQVPAPVDGPASEELTADSALPRPVARPVQLVQTALTTAGPTVPSVAIPAADAAAPVQTTAGVTPDSGPGVTLRPILRPAN